MEPSDPQTKKCRQCKRCLPLLNFLYFGKDHITCQVCAESRRKPLNRCEICDKVAVFNFEDQNRGIRCKQHSLPNMVDIKNLKCVVCHQTQPNFNYENEMKATHCGKCALPNMIDVKHPKCIVCKKTQPVFNYENETKATHCGKCSLPNMVNVKSLKCVVCHKIRPNFNYENETKATHCSKCALPEMIDIKHPKCIVCKKMQPNFNYENEMNATHCGKCALPNMIDVKNLKCVVCHKTQPSFNYENEMNATHCGKCALPNMIDVKNKKCIVCRKTQPNFNYEGETKPTHCSKCALPNMIDVKNPKCSLCKTSASYGIPLNRPTRCVSHKEDGMISNPRANCLKRGCRNKALFGTNKPIHCEEHKNDNDINLVERKCVCCDRIDVVDSNGFSVNYCSKDKEFESYRKRIKIEEERVYKIISAECGKPDSTNKKISNDCGDEEKPDFIYDCKTHMVVVEADERAHRDRCKLGEFNRMKNIFMSFGGTPVVFIRYNPHPHKENGKTVKVPQSKKEETLVKWVRYLKDIEPTELCSVVYLYYDENDTTQFRIDPYDSKVYKCGECDNEYHIESMFLKHALKTQHEKCSEKEN